MAGAVRYNADGSIVRVSCTADALVFQQLSPSRWWMAVSRGDDDGTVLEFYVSGAGPIRCRPAPKDRHCLTCRKQFRSDAYQAQYCSDRCRHTMQKRRYRAKRVA